MAALRRRARAPQSPGVGPAGGTLAALGVDFWLAPGDGPWFGVKAPPKAPPRPPPRTSPRTSPRPPKGNLRDWLIGQRPGRGHEPEPVAQCHPHLGRPRVTPTRTRASPTWRIGAVGKT